jgi:hypothetical protein
LEGRKNGSGRGTTKNEIRVGKLKNEKVKMIMEERSAERQEM